MCSPYKDVRRGTKNPIPINLHTHKASHNYKISLLVKKMSKHNPKLENLKTSAGTEFQKIWENEKRYDLMVDDDVAKDNE